jgi:hypothetical protein
MGRMRRDWWLDEAHESLDSSMSSSRVCGSRRSNQDRLEQTTASASVRRQRRWLSADARLHTPECVTPRCVAASSHTRGM